MGFSLGSPGASSRVSVNKKDIEAIYPLSPVQQGMLFHTLYAPESGEYFVAGRLTLQGDLEVARFREAWQQLTDRHPVLRTAVAWEGLKEPLQVVRRRVELPWREEDLRDCSAAEREEWLEDFLHKDRQRGFELSKGPLTRITLIRAAEHTYELIWSFHHLLLDGWSAYLL